MQELKIILQGEPCGQGRPRFSSKGGFVRAYDPAKSRDYKSAIAIIAKSTMAREKWHCTDEPLSIKVTAYMSIPKSKSKKFKQAAIEGQIYPSKKPDCDNILKIAMDGLNGIAYQDDKQIINASISKFYANEPRLDIRIQKIGGD